MTEQVQVIYDFAGAPDSNELSIAVGEILTVTNWEAGEGWWEGTNSKGETGIFPAAYTENIAPTLRTDDTPSYEQDWGWNNSESDDSQQLKIDGYTSNLPTPAEDSVPVAPSQSIQKSNKMLSKSGDSYILGNSCVNVPENKRVFVLPTETGYIWKPILNPYSVRVASPKKEKKLGGMKTFIAYQLTPSFNNTVVSRRYKHFDWLHVRLVDKFSLIPIPPLPDKQISGRYEEQFIEHRRVQLQEFVDWLCRHPVLSACEVWMHFLTCTDEKRWKIGKRVAEKDVLCGLTYCAAIYPPEQQLLQSQVDSHIDTCHTFVHRMSGAVKNLIGISDDQKKKFELQWKKDYQRVGEGLSELARALEVDKRRDIPNFSLSNSVGQAAGVYIAIGKHFSVQPNFDWVPLADRLHIYRGILNAFPDVLSEHKNGMQTRKECEKFRLEQKMDNAQLQEVNRRTDIMSYAVMSEMSHFRSERDQHLKETLRNFLDAQIQFYKEVVRKLELAKEFF